MGELEYEPMTHAEKIQWMLDEQGWGAVPVRPAASAAPGGAGYTYTFGLERLFGRPEIVICGLQPVQARGLLDLVVAQYRAGIELPADPPFVGLLDNDLPAVLLTIDPVANATLSVPRSRRRLGPVALWFGRRGRASVALKLMVPGGLGLSGGVRLLGSTR